MEIKVKEPEIKLRTYGSNYLRERLQEILPKHYHNELDSAWGSSASQKHDTLEIMCLIHISEQLEKIATLLQKQSFTASKQ